MFGVGGTGEGGEWVRYVREPHRPVEAMHAHFERHSYHRHSHDTYSFGVTDAGAQAFTCRGGSHTSTSGMIMAFNPDEPHDGSSATPGGFTYRIVHIGPSLVRETLGDLTGRPTGLPLFATPVVHDALVAQRLRALHGALMADTEPLRRDELLTRAIGALVGRGSTGALRPSVPASARDIAVRVRSMLHDGYAEAFTAQDLALAAGCSRYAVYRAFTATYGLAPSDYQRQLRLRAARGLLCAGRPAAEVAVQVGFADQAHLTRWFVRAYGVTPSTYRRAAPAG